MLMLMALRSYEYSRSCRKVRDVAFMRVISKPNKEHASLGRFSIDAERIHYNLVDFLLIRMLYKVQNTETHKTQNTSIEM